MTHNAVDAYAGLAARVVALVGKAMGWIMVPVVCLVFSVAVLRYGFGIVGILAILLPTVAVIAYWSWTPIVFSWRRLEGSRALDGLPGVFLLKSVVLVFCALMAVQAFVYLRANLRALRSPPSRP
jgi:TRAP-type mannitol/chloroaromatic compound transport system permease small subunit